MQIVEGRRAEQIQQVFKNANFEFNLLVIKSPKEFKQQQV